MGKNKVMEQRMAALGIKTPRQVALRAGVSEMTVGRFFNGRTRSMNPVAMEKVARLLGTTADELLGHGINQDTTMVEIMDAARHLTADQRREAARYLRFMAQEKKTHNV